MESFFVRYRNLVVLLAVLLAQIIGLAMQVRRTDSGRNSLDAKDGAGVRLIRLWADSLVTPPELLFHASKLDALDLWTTTSPCATPANRIRSCRRPSTGSAWNSGSAQDPTRRRLRRLRPHPPSSTTPN